jgi:hypothetical protein
MEDNGMDWYRKHVGSIFWPARQPRPILVCSAIVGPAVDTLLLALQQNPQYIDKLPGWELFGDPKYVAVRIRASLANIY